MKVFDINKVEGLPTIADDEREIIHIKIWHRFHPVFVSVAIVRIYYIFDHLPIMDHQNVSLTDVHEHLLFGILKYRSYILTKYKCRSLLDICDAKTIC